MFEALFVLVFLTACAGLAGFFVAVVVVGFCWAGLLVAFPFDEGLALPAFTVLPIVFALAPGLAVPVLTVLVVAFAFNPGLALSAFPTLGVVFAFAPGLVVSAVAVLVVALTFGPVLVVVAFTGFEVVFPFVAGLAGSSFVFLVALAAPAFLTVGDGLDSSVPCPAAWVFSLNEAGLVFGFTAVRPFEVFVGFPSPALGAAGSTIPKLSCSIAGSAGSSGSSGISASGSAEAFSPATGRCITHGMLIPVTAYPLFKSMIVLPEAARVCRGASSMRIAFGDSLSSITVRRALPLPAATPTSCEVRGSFHAITPCP